MTSPGLDSTLLAVSGTISVDEGVAIGATVKSLNPGTATGVGASGRTTLEMISVPSLIATLTTVEIG